MRIFEFRLVELVQNGDMVGFKEIEGTNPDAKYPLIKFITDEPPYEFITNGKQFYRIWRGYVGEKFKPSNELRGIIEKEMATV